MYFITINNKNNIGERWNGRETRKESKDTSTRVGSVRACVSVCARACACARACVCVFKADYAYIGLHRRCNDSRQELDAFLSGLRHHNEF